MTGTSGAGAGQGGVSGAASGGAAGAGGGAQAGTSGAGGSGETCTGCARISVPLTSTADKGHFVISLAGGPDFTTAVVNYRIFVRTGTTGSFTGYVQDNSGFTYRALGSVSLGSVVGWQDVSWPVGTGNTGFDRTQIQTIGIEISGAAGAANPSVVYVDSITVPALALSFTFDDASSILVTPQMEHLADQRMWQNTDSVAGSVLAWLGP